MSFKIQKEDVVKIAKMGLDYAESSKVIGGGKRLGAIEADLGLVRHVERLLNNEIELCVTKLKAGVIIIEYSKEERVINGGRV